MRRDKDYRVPTFAKTVSSVKPTDMVRTVIRFARKPTRKSAHAEQL